MKCKECGADFKAKQYNAEFCCGKHRNEFNNRRALRGATLYDLEMISRNEPDKYVQHGLGAVRERVIAYWRIDDELKRAGRKSWKGAFNVLSDLIRFAGN